MRSKIGKVVIDATYGLQTSEQATEEERKRQSQSMDIQASCSSTATAYRKPVVTMKTWCVD